jgi:hypothetical protein
MNYEMSHLTIREVVISLIQKIFLRQDCNCSIILEQNPFLKKLKDQDAKGDEAMEVELSE